MYLYFRQLENRKSLVALLGALLWTVVRADMTNRARIAEEPQSITPCSWQPQWRFGSSSRSPSSVLLDSGSFWSLLVLCYSLITRVSFRPGTHHDRGTKCTPATFSEGKITQTHGSLRARLRAFVLTRLLLRPPGFLLGAKEPFGTRS